MEYLVALVSSHSQSLYSNSRGESQVPAVSSKPFLKASPMYVPKREKESTMHNNTWTCLKMTIPYSDWILMEKVCNPTMLKIKGHSKEGILWKKRKQVIPYFLTKEGGVRKRIIFLLKSQPLICLKTQNYKVKTQNSSSHGSILRSKLGSPVLVANANKDSKGYRAVKVEGVLWSSIFLNSRLLKSSQILMKIDQCYLHRPPAQQCLLHQWRCLLNIITAMNSNLLTQLKKLSAPAVDKSQQKRKKREKE